MANANDMPMQMAGAQGGLFRLPPPFQRMACRLPVSGVIS